MTTDVNDTTINYDSGSETSISNEGENLETSEPQISLEDDCKMLQDECEAQEIKFQNLTKSIEDDKLAFDELCKELESLGITKQPDKGGIPKMPEKAHKKVMSSLPKDKERLKERRGYLSTYRSDLLKVIGVMKNQKENLEKKIQEYKVELCDKLLEKSRSDDKKIDELEIKVKKLQTKKELYEKMQLIREKLKAELQDSTKTMTTAKYMQICINLGIIDANDRENLDVCHIIANSHGGADHPDNYLILNKSFNRMIGDRFDPLNCFLAGKERTMAAMKISMKLGNTPRNNNEKKHYRLRENSLELSAECMCREGELMVNSIDRSLRRARRNEN